MMVMEMLKMMMIFFKMFVHHFPGKEREMRKNSFVSRTTTIKNNSCLSTKCWLAAPFLKMFEKKTSFLSQERQQEQLALVYKMLGATFVGIIEKKKKKKVGHFVIIKFVNPQTFLCLKNEHNDNSKKSKKKTFFKKKKKNIFVVFLLFWRERRCHFFCRRHVDRNSFTMS